MATGYSSPLLCPFVISESAHLAAIALRLQNGYRDEWLNPKELPLKYVGRVHVFPTGSGVSQTRLSWDIQPRPAILLHISIGLYLGLTNPPQEVYINHRSW